MSQPNKNESGDESMQMTETIFAADTCDDDDDSFVIPPTPDLIVPNTPPRNYSDGQDNLIEKNDTLISELEETIVEDSVLKPTVRTGVDVSTDNCDSQADLTQDLEEIEATQPLLPSRVEDDSVKVIDEDSDDSQWLLRCSESQETQELLSVTRLKQEMSQKNADVKIGDEKFKLDPIKETDECQVTEESILESSPIRQEAESCLVEEEHPSYLSFSDQLLQNANDAHSTPDAFTNGRTIQTVNLVDTTDVLSVNEISFEKETDSKNKDSVFDKFGKCTTSRNESENDSVLVNPSVSAVSVELLAIKKNLDEIEKDTAHVEDDVQPLLSTQEKKTDSALIAPVESSNSLSQHPANEFQIEHSTVNAAISITSEGLKAVDTSNECPISDFNEPLPPKHKLTRRAVDSRTKSPRNAKYPKIGKTNFGCIKSPQSLNNIFSSFGVLLDPKTINDLLKLKQKEKMKVRKIYEFVIEYNNLDLNEILDVVPGDDILSPHLVRHLAVTSTLHSGEMADISSSSSGQTGNSSAPLDTTIPSSQDSVLKTSTQNSGMFSGMFQPSKTNESLDDKDMAHISPIVLNEKLTRTQEKEEPPPKTNTPKRKRGRPPPKKEAAVNYTSEESVPNAIRPTRRPRKLKKIKAPVPVDLPSVQEDIHLNESAPLKSSPESSAGLASSKVIPGIRVMAKWGDGFYYPGQVVNEEPSGKWAILFDDERTKVVSEDVMIKIAMLPAGTSVLVLSHEDDGYDPGIVCGQFCEGRQFGYEVELDKGVTKRFPRTSVILSTDQAKLLQDCSVTPSATSDINLDNIVGGKRKRKSVPSSDFVEVKRNRPSHGSEKVDPNIENTGNSSCISEIESSSSHSRRTRVADGGGEASTSIRPTRKAAKMVASKVKQTIIDSRLKNPKLFKDYVFLLSTVERKPTENDDSECEEEYVIPYDKEELMDIIIARGGTILDSFENIKKSKKKKLLLAQSCLRTIKYIQCLAAGILCINYNWIQQCCFIEEISSLTEYILPAGKSIITDSIVEWHYEKNILKGLKISLLSGSNSKFVEIWAPVLLAANANFVRKWSLPSFRPGASTFILITDSQCPQEIVESAKKQQIPIVSSEWIIQSLIAGKRLPYTAHPKFRHDFTE